MAWWSRRRGRDPRLVDRWFGAQAEEDWLHERCRLAAACIEEGANVADLGCGLQVLREHLHASCTYTGYDLGDMHPDNVLLDLDGPFAIGSGRTGIATGGAFTGNIVNSSGTPAERCDATLRKERWH